MRAANNGRRRHAAPGSAPCGGARCAVGAALPSEAAARPGCPCPLPPSRSGGARGGPPSPSPALLPCFGPAAAPPRPFCSEVPKAEHRSPGEASPVPSAGQDDFPGPAQHCMPDPSQDAAGLGLFVARPGEGRCCKQQGMLNWFGGDVRISHFLWSCLLTEMSYTCVFKVKINLSLLSQTITAFD